ncbi:hypothetical protein, partial [Brevibacillus sp. SKDU10]|uniref:hypothetical protein n=1 Tax=Brevibacillus sp. SKDU10 TaxID=1247872 RepID=UPI0018D46DC3
VVHAVVHVVVHAVVRAVVPVAAFASSSIASDAVVVPVASRVLKATLSYLRKRDSPCIVKVFGLQGLSL